MRIRTLGRYAITGCVAAAILAAPCLASSSAADVAPLDRSGMALAVADYIRDDAAQSSTVFRGKAVELGATVIERPWALAEWRSDDRTVLAAGSEGLGRVQLVALGVPAASATTRTTGLAKLENERVTYVEVRHPGRGCKR